MVKAKVFVTLTHDRLLSCLSFTFKRSQVFGDNITG